MADALAFVQDNGGNLLIAGWVITVVLFAAALVRIIRGVKRATSTPINKELVDSGTVLAAPIGAMRASTGNGHQAERMFAILDEAATSADRAIRAHAAAGKQLDSAEYQLQRLFVEFPMLSAARSKSSLTPPARAGIVAQVSPRILAAAA